MEAIGKWVFSKREEQEDTFGGINISEKACIKNYISEISHIASDKIVTTGDIVHIPHYGVEDVIHDGQEYAVFDSKRLFAKKVDDEWIPINGYVKVRKCVNDHIRDSSGEIKLYQTENHIEHTQWVQVLDVAEDCKLMHKRWIGYYCFSPESDERLCRILYSKDYMLHEDLIQFVTTGE